MSPDHIVGAAIGLALAAHLAALLWLWRPNRFALLLRVNAAVSLAVLAYQVQRIRYILAPPSDGQILMLAAFEVLVLAFAIGACKGGRVPVAVSCLAFAVHLCASVAALAFMLTFQMTRLI